MAVFRFARATKQTHVFRSGSENETAYRLEDTFANSDLNGGRGA